VTSEQQLKLQAFLDGELPEKEARDVASWVARDVEATDLLKEMRHTRQALAGFEPVRKVPESREFYWSKIEREIRRLQPEPAVPQWPSVLSWFRRRLLPACALAALTLVTTIAGFEFGLFGPGHRPEMELAQGDSATFTYHDYASGTTLVWLEYPAER
jgi:anti-sigma factor RsiW